MQVNKNFIINFISDLSGQGQIRNVWPFSTINQIYGPQQKLVNMWCHTFGIDQRILYAAKTLYFQRQMTESQLMAIRHYKEMQSVYKYKMVWDMDDLIWGWNELQGGDKESGIPSYNFSHKNITKAEKDASIEIMKMMDVLLFSTDYLGRYVRDTLGVTTPYIVIPNTVPRAYWGDDAPKLKTDDIKKPKILYSGSPTHYNNQTKHLGDWDNAWRHWVIDNVKKNNIDFVCMGGLPFFFDEIKNKIKVYDWTQLFNMHLIIKKEAPDFCINPLIRNDFNRCKSDLKLVESSAAGMVCVGTVFDDNSASPFDECFVKVSEYATKKQINEIIFENCNKDKWNNIVLQQHEWMHKNGRYTESPTAINRLVKAIT